MKLKDYLEIAQGYCCLLLNDSGIQTRVFDNFGFNQESRILNRKVITFWTDRMEGRLVQYIKVECKNLNDIKDFFLVKNKVVYYES